MKRILAATDNVAKLRNELKTHCETAGYTFDDVEWDGNYLHFYIYPNTKFGSDVTAKTRRGSKGVFVSAQTSAFGALDPTEYKEFAKQIKLTAELVDYLSKFDWEALKED